MSEIIRRMNGISAAPEVRRATTRELARLCHEAEDTANDLLLVDVQTEVERREHAFPGTLRLFKDYYWIEWANRKNPKLREKTDGV